MPPDEGATIARDGTEQPEAGAEGDLPLMDETGRRLQTFLSCSDFADQQGAMQRILGQPRGYTVPVGRIAGYASKVERRPSSLKPKPGQDKAPDSIWIGGEFESTSSETGEVRAGPWLILPSAAGQLIEAAFQAGADRALLDLEISIGATGRTIPYEWVVRAYGTRQTEAQRVVDAIRARQDARARQKALAAPSPANGADKPNPS
jgi:hypothetical protein